MIFARYINENEICYYGEGLNKESAFKDLQDNCECMDLDSSIDPDMVTFWEANKISGRVIHKFEIVD